MVVAGVENPAAPRVDGLDVLAGDHGQLTERLGRAHHLGVADCDTHALEGLVEVDRVGGGAKERRRRLHVQRVPVLDDLLRCRSVDAEDHRGGQCVAGGGDGHLRAGELGRGQVVVAANSPGAEVGDGPVDAHEVPHLDSDSSPGENEEPLAAGRVVVGRGALNPVATSAHRRDDPTDAVDGLACEWRDVARSLDLRDRLGLVDGREVGAGRHLNRAVLWGRVGGAKVRGVVVGVGAGDVARGRRGVAQG